MKKSFYFQTLMTFFHLQLTPLENCAFVKTAMYADGIICIVYPFYGKIPASSLILNVILKQEVL